MRFSREFIQKVAEAADIVSVVTERGVQLKQTGSNYKGLCPFHSEKTPSFSVNAQQGFFHCFGCSAGGNAIQFVQQYDRLSFVEALTELAERFGVPLEKKASSFQNKSEDRVMQALDRAAQFYHNFLLHQPLAAPAREYLEKRSVPQSILQTFQMGFAPNDWQVLFQHLMGQGFKQNELLQAGLVKISQKSGRPYDVFRHRILFPIRDMRGRCIGFGGRQIDPNTPPKYLNSAESKYYHKSQVLYGFYEGREAIRKDRHLILVEGYLDVTRLHEFGFQQAVATCGTSLTAEHLRFAQRHANKVILLLDGDSAGQAAAWRSCPLFLSGSLEGAVVNLPAGEDPDSFLLSRGKEAFSALLQQEVPVFEYLVQHCLAKHSPDVQGRTRAVEELLPLIGNIQDEMTKNMAVAHLAELTHIAPKSLLEKLSQSLHSSSSRARLVGLNHEDSPSPEHPDEKRILQALLHFRASGNLIQLAREQLHSHEFATPHLRQIYQQLLQFSDQKLATLEIQEWEQHWPGSFPQIMGLFMETLPLDLEKMSADMREVEFKRWMGRVKRRNLKGQFDERLNTLQTVEEIGQAHIDFRKQQSALDQIFPQR